MEDDRGVVVASTRGMQPHQIRVRSTWGGAQVTGGKVVVRERVVVWARKWWRRA